MTRSIQGERQPLGRPWTRRALMRDLALGDVTQAALAERYGVSPAAVTYFKQRFAAEIEDIRGDAEGEYAGVLIARKINRLQMYQEAIERAEDSGDDKLLARLLRQVAEECGHLPSRIQVSGQLDTQTRYVIDGVDTGDLR